MADRRFLYLFLDESGNFDFSPTGTKYFTLTCLAKERPLSAYKDLSELKYDLIEMGLPIEYFHAAEDRQAVRNRVFEVIGRHSERMLLDSLIIEKSKTEPKRQKHDRFYPEMLGELLQTVLSHYALEEFEEVVVFTDKLPESSRQVSIEKAVKPILSEVLPKGAKYRLLHHSSKSNFYLQVVDYCNWAIYRRWAMSDLRSYDLIRGFIRSEREIFCDRTDRFY